MIFLQFMVLGFFLSVRGFLVSKFDNWRQTGHSAQLHLVGNCATPESSMGVAKKESPKMGLS